MLSEELMIVVVVFVGTVWVLNFIHGLLGNPVTAWWTSTELHRRLVKLLTREA